VNKKRLLHISVSVYLTICLALAWLTPAMAVGVTGAIFTTDSTCTGVNVNLFADKAAVYIDGGPHHLGSAGLPDGAYYVRITTPDGSLLGTSVGSANNTPVQVLNGEFVHCYKLSAILIKASDGAPGYDNTSNPGGVYKVWVSLDATFAPELSKTDNFKVEAEVLPGELQVIKFYDANANGQNDDGILLTGWKVHIYDGVDYIRYTLVDIFLPPDTYWVNEFMPNETNWIATTEFPVQVTLPEEGKKTVEFGNLCLGPGGGRTLGFWSNKNGQAMVDTADLAMLVGLNLRNESGANFDPADYNQLRTWLLNGRAVNMAYMLSVQLTAMELNVFNGLVNGNALLYAPGAASANPAGFATVNAVMTEANTELGLHGYTPAGNAFRRYQGMLKTILDDANNNKNFVQEQPCPYTFPEEPTVKLYAGLPSVPAGFSATYLAAVRH
jgi:hypothetical protein